MNVIRPRRNLYIGLLLLLLTLAGAPAAPSEQPHLILISIDGLVPDYYVRPDRLGLRIPNLRRLRRDGFYAEGVIGVYPSVTYPSHTTIVTGAKPADHGIVANTIFDDPTRPPTRRWYWGARRIKTDTLWAAAKRAGLRVGSVRWPVTVGAKEIDWNLPEIWDPFNQRKSQFAILRKYTTPGLIDNILLFQKKTESDYRVRDEFVVDSATYLIVRFKPNLLLVHLIDLDGEQHHYGPYSKQALEMTEQEDADVGRLLDAIRHAGIEASTTVGIVSDHGFMRVEKQFSPGVLLVQAGLIRLNEEGRVTSWDAAVHANGGSAAVYLKHPESKTIADEVTKLFESYAEKPDSPLRQVLNREEVRRQGANPDAYLFLEAAAHYTITGKVRGPVVEKTAGWSRGMHGYLPRRPEMYASLILWGRGIRARQHREMVRMTDIAPTLAQLLNIKLEAPAYSHPLNDILRRVRRSPRAAGAKLHE